MCLVVYPSVPKNAKPNFGYFDQNWFAFGWVPKSGLVAPSHVPSGHDIVHFSDQIWPKLYGH